MDVHETDGHLQYIVSSEEICTVQRQISISWLDVEVETRFPQSYHHGIFVVHNYQNSLLTDEVAPCRVNTAYDGVCAIQKTRLLSVFSVVRHVS